MSDTTSRGPRFRPPTAGQIIGSLVRARRLRSGIPRSAERWFSGECVKEDTQRETIRSLALDLCTHDGIVRALAEVERETAVDEVTNALLGAASAWDTLVGSFNTATEGDATNRSISFFAHCAVCVIAPRVAALRVLAGLPAPRSEAPGWAMERPGDLLKALINERSAHLLKRLGEKPGTRLTTQVLARVFGRERNTVDRWFNRGERPLDLKEVAERLEESASACAVVESWLEWNYAVAAVCDLARPHLPTDVVKEIATHFQSDVANEMPKFESLSRERLRQIVLGAPSENVDAGPAEPTSNTQLDPRARASQVALKAELAYLAGDLESAVRGHRESLKIDPSDAQHHYRLGFLLAQQGNEEEALRLFAEAVRLNPEHEIARIETAYVLMRHGKLAEAAAHLERQSVELGGAGWRSDYCLGIARMLASRLEEALTLLESADAARPQHGHILDYAAQCAFVLGDMTRGARYAKQAHEQGVSTAWRLWNDDVYSAKKRRTGERPPIVFDV